VKFGGVIVAAGLSSRMGSFKPLLPLEGHTIIERIIRTLQEGGVEDISVVTGRDASRLEEALTAYKLNFIHNTHYATTDMFRSAVMGLSFMAERTDAVFFTPVDIPLFTAYTIRLMAGTIQKDGHHILIPRYGGRDGHPIVMRSEAAGELIRCKKPGGLRGAVDAYGGSKGFLEVDDSGVLYDADTPEDYWFLVSRNYTNAI
jgi:CTP:molybdopterin cytidylyltransferase MocA